MQESKLWIYVLRLKEDKYYVGKTSQPDKRIQDHRDGKGSYWTSLYPMIDVAEQFEGDTFDEDKYVKKYMAEFGIDNVRGGSYVRQHLSPEDEAVLKKELLGASDACFRCGRDSHFANACYATRHLDGHLLTKNPKRNQIRRPRIKKTTEENNEKDKVDELLETSSDSSEEIETPIPEIEKPVEKVVGRPPPPREIVYRPVIVAQPKTAKPCLSCRGDHDILDCPTKGEICYRCGSKDHWKITCTATKDVNGYPLQFDVVGQIGATLKSWFF